MPGLFSVLKLFGHLGDLDEAEISGPGPAPVDAYVAEDGTTYYVNEANTAYYVPEVSPDLLANDSITLLIANDGVSGLITEAA